MEPENSSPVRGWSQQKFVTVVVGLVIGAFVFWCCMCGLGGAIADM